MRALREPTSVIFTLLFTPAFIGCMGPILGNNLLPEFGGKGFPEADLTAFPGIVIAISALIIVPVDLMTQQGAGVLRRLHVTPLNPILYLVADAASHLVLGLVSFATMYAIAVLGFRVRPTSAGAFISTPAATMLGLAAFLTAGYLIVGRLRNIDAAQGLGSILMYPPIFTSNTAVPLAVLPPSTLSVTKHSSITQLAYLIRGLWDDKEWGEYWTVTLILLVLGTVCVAAAVRFFRWE